MGKAKSERMAFEGSILWVSPYGVEHEQVTGFNKDYHRGAGFCSFCGEEFSPSNEGIIVKSQFGQAGGRPDAICGVCAGLVDF